MFKVSPFLLNVSACFVKSIKNALNQSICSACLYVLAPWHQHFKTSFYNKQHTMRRTRINPLRQPRRKIILSSRNLCAGFLGIISTLYLFAVAKHTNHATNANVFSESFLMQGSILPSETKITIAYGTCMSCYSFGHESLIRLICHWHCHCSFLKFHFFSSQYPSCYTDELQSGFYRWWGGCLSAFH